MFKKIRYTLSLQLSFNIVLLFSVMILILGLSVLQFINSTIKTELTNRLESESSLTIERVESLFENSILKVKQLSIDRDIQNYLKEVSTREQVKTHPLYEEVLDTLGNIRNSDARIFLTWVANENANFYLDNHAEIPDTTYDVKVRPWYKTANSKEGINFTEPYIEWETNKIVVSAIEALYDNDQPYGFIAVDFKLDTLPDVISQIDVGENGQIFIIDEYGTYMYHADATNVLTLSMKDEIGELYNYINQEDHISSTLNSIQVDGKNFYVFTQKLHYMDWSLVTLLDKNEVHKNLYNFIFYMSILTIVLSTIIIFSIVKIIQNKVAPISALKNYGSKIANGQLDEHPPYEYATRNDEMGDLARSFVTITEVFKQKNALLEEVVTSQYAEIQEQYHYILEKEKMASLGTLVAGVAHEINTPLGIGVTTSSYIEEIVKLLNTHFEEKTLSKTVLTQNLVSLIEASHILSVNLMRAADLVQQFKSIATNQNIEMLSSFNLCTEISNVIASLRPTFKHKKIMIQNDCLESILMSSYPGALTQIFTNLMMNSMFHGFEDDQEGLIHITASLDGELVRIMYSDNGKGIKKDDLDRIFEPFFTTRRKKGSSGLGMYITHNLTTQTLSGTISCESTIGNGVLFKILLPLHLKAEDPKEIE